MTWARPLLALLMLIAAACATAGDAPPATELRVESNVPDASLYIDDVLVGRVVEWSRGGRSIRPGAHRVEIRHPEHYSHFAEIEAREGARMVLIARLRRRLD